MAKSPYYTDVRINSYDEQRYLGNINEKKISHIGEVVVTDPLICAYCSETFESRNKLFLHLGYCDVDIRPSYMKENNKKYKQLKITKFMSCMDYDADIEDNSYDMDIDMDIITRMVKKLSTNHKNNKTNQNNKINKINKINQTNKKMKNIKPKKIITKTNLHCLFDSMKIS